MGVDRQVADRVGRRRGGVAVAVGCMHVTADAGSRRQLEQLSGWDRAGWECCRPVHRHGGRQFRRGASRGEMRLRAELNVQSIVPEDGLGDCSRSRMQAVRSIVWRQARGWRWMAPSEEKTCRGSKTPALRYQIEVQSCGYQVSTTARRGGRDLGGR